MSDIVLPELHPEVFILPNGLEIIVHEDHTAPVASIQAWVRTGSIHEGIHLGSGISHLLEHMLFKGTPTRGSQDFARTVQDHGGYINAYTSFDRTVYWVDIPASGVSATLELLSDALMNSTLPVDELVKEQEVIRREFAMGCDDPDSVSGKLLFKTAFNVHPMRHPIIGHLDIFNTLTHDDLLAYYRERYAPNNIFFVIVGAVNSKAVHEQLAGFFEKHPRRRLPDIFIPSEPLQMGRREQHIEFDTELTRMSLSWHVPGDTHPDLPALDILSTVLGSGRSARLYRRLREDLGILHSVDAWCYTTTHAGLFGIDAILDPAKLDTVRDEVQKIVHEVQNEAIPTPLLDKARRMFLSHQLSSLVTMRGKASDLGANWLSTRNLRFSHDYLAAAQKITPSDLQHIALKYLREENLTATSLNPPKTQKTTTQTQPINQRGDTQLFHLPNGLRLLVREDHRLPLVSIAATFKAGVLAEHPEVNGITRLLSHILLRGTERRSAEQIANEIESAGGEISCSSGSASIFITARVMQPEIALGIDLIADVIRNATLPEKVIAREIEAQLAAIKASDEDISSVAMNALRSKIFFAHRLSQHPLGEPSSVQSLSREKLLAFRDQYLCAKNCVISVFGAVKTEEVRLLIEQHLSDLPSGCSALEKLPSPDPILTPMETIVHKPKEQAVLMVGFHGTDLFSPDRIILELIDEACSDLGSRLFNRIREEMGLAYFVGANNAPTLTRGAFLFFLGTDPLKLPEVQTALNEEIARLATTGLDSQELARAKEKMLGTMEIRNQSNNALALCSAIDELYGIGYAYHEKLRERIEVITEEMVRAAAFKYFTQPSVTVIARSP